MAIQQFDMSDPLVRQLVKHEGKRNKKYKDSEGNWTIGVGFNLTKPGAKEKLISFGIDIRDILDNDASITNFQMQDLLQSDIDEAREQTVGLYSNWSTISDTRQRALIEMTFTMGRHKMLGFEDMKIAIEKEDWDGAADEAMDSKWYREDVAKERGDAVASMLRYGPSEEFPPLPSPNPLREENEFANRP